MSNMIENPFLNNKIPINYHDDNSGEVIELEQENISKYFSYIYILAKKTNEPIPIEFYNLHLNKNVFDKVASNLLIHKTSVKVLKNKHHFDEILIMSDFQLSQFNIFNYNLESKNIVLPILNIPYQNLLKYFEQYVSSDTLENIYKIKVLNKYFSVNDSNYRINEYLCSMISNMEDSDYWTQYYNCSINFTTKFKDRSFNFQSNRIENKNAANIIKEMFNNQQKKINTENYIDELNENKKNNYVDISSIIGKKSNNLYYISAKSEFTKDEITKLFETLNKKQKFFLFSELIVSKKHAHLVVNNEHILTTMYDTINKHALLFKYLFSYAWLKFYFEECIKKSFVCTSDDFIFDINTASKLPVFPFNHKKPKENPYMPILVADVELNPDKNICGIPDYYTIDKNIINSGICNLDEFKIRMNIFCTGNPNFDIFDGFDFDKYKVGITGSIITACIQRSHPLMSRFLNCNNQTVSFNNYFNEYYSKSDIDVMIIAKDNFTFIDNSHHFYNQIVINLCKYNSTNIELSHIKLKMNKIGYLFVSEKFIEKNIDFDDKTIENKINYVLKNINEPFIYDKFRPYFDKLRVEKTNEIIKDLTPDEVINLKMRYPEVFTNDEIEFRVYINNREYTKTLNNNLLNTDDDHKYIISSDDKYIKDIDLVFTYKFKIESPYLNHSFELFSVRYDDFFSIVSRFHLPCVRGYYNGTNVYLTPSCISAHMTYMNIDYKYICGTKDPIEIINKNRMRGFGTWLNSTERKHFVKYSRNLRFWNNLYNIDSKVSDIDASKQIVGPLSLNHRMFRPRLYNMEEYVDSVYVDTTDRYNISTLPDRLIDNEDKNYDDKNKLFHSRYGSIFIKEIDYSNLQSIDMNGYIVPLKKWVIRSTWELTYNK
jgi:hypothetical protein